MLLSNIKYSCRTVGPIILLTNIHVTDFGAHSESFVSPHRRSLASKYSQIKFYSLKKKQKQRIDKSSSLLAAFHHFEGK